MATYADVITAALQDLGVLQAGETPSGEDQAYCLTRLNRLLDQWAAERLQIYTVTRSTWTITANDGQYSVGSGGDVNIARPVFVEHVSVIDTSTDPDAEFPLAMITDDAYAGISLKAQTSSYPSYAYYNPTYPTGTLILWPVPTSSTLQGAIYAAAAIAQAATAGTSFSAPPGYQRMMETNLALEVAPGFSRDPSAVLVRAAMDSMAKVKRANYRLSDMSVDRGALAHSQTGAGWDIFTGP